MAPHILQTALWINERKRGECFKSLLRQSWWLYSICWILIIRFHKRLGTGGPTKTENHIANFTTKCSLWRDCCVLYDPISHEMHVVQQFNMVLPLNWLKTYPKKTLLYHFHAEKALLKVQNLQYKFLDWKLPPPWNFSENSSVLVKPSVPKHMLTKVGIVYRILYSGLLCKASLTFN